MSWKKPTLARWMPFGFVALFILEIVSSAKYFGGRTASTGGRRVGPKRSWKIPKGSSRNSGAVKNGFWSEDILRGGWSDPVARPSLSSVVPDRAIPLGGLVRRLLTVQIPPPAVV